MRLVGDSNRSGESDGFRNFLVSIGIEDTKFVFFILGLLCALAIHRVRISSIVVFPASLLVFAIGFSFGLVRSGNSGEVSSNEIKKRAKEESLRVFAEKLRNLVEIFDGFDFKVNNLKNDIQRAINSREVTTVDLENYIKALETVSSSVSNARNIIGSNVGISNSVLADNQKSSKKKKELSEIGCEILQSIGGLFGESLVGSKPNKVKSNAKRGTMEASIDDQVTKSNVVPLVEERVQNSVDVNKPKANSGPSQDSQNKCALDEDGDERSKSGNMNRDDTGGRVNNFTARKEYSSETNRLQFSNNDITSLKMGHDNVRETWESRDTLLDSVNFSVRMKHTETEASFVQAEKLKKSDGSYRPSFTREQSKNNTSRSLLRDDLVSGKDNLQMANELSDHASDVPSTSSSMVSDDVTFDRHLTEANEMLKRAKEFIRDREEKEQAEIVLYRCAKLLSKAITMKPMSLLAVGQLGNTYLLHGELKLRISQELRSLIVRSNPSPFSKWTGELDRNLSKDEIASVLIDVCEECEELLVEAGRKYRLALSIDGNDVRALYNWGLALFFRAQLIADIGPVSTSFVSNSAQLDGHISIMFSLFSCCY